MLLADELEAVYSPPRPQAYHPRTGAIARLFPDFRLVEQDYFRQTGAFPPQHLMVLRREVWDANRWIARSLTEAFSAANDWFTASQKGFPYATPWLEAELEETEAVMGERLPSARPRGQPGADRDVRRRGVPARLHEPADHRRGVLCGLPPRRLTAWPSSWVPAPIATRSSTTGRSCRPGREFNADVAAVGVDAQDRVYAFNRGAHPMCVFDRDGNFLRSWGEGVFRRAHGVHVAPDDTLWLTDDGDHTVRHCTLDGKVLLTLGVPGVPKPYMSGEPFHRCTHTALSPQGDLYVSDGYGNSRVHKYSPDGTLQRSWGEPGTDPGQFNIAHNICCDAEGWVYVADRENHRVQVFDGNGRYETQWNNMHRPSGLYLEPRAAGPLLRGRDRRGHGRQQRHAQHRARA